MILSCLEEQPCHRQRLLTLQYFLWNNLDCGLVCLPIAPETIQLETNYLQSHSVWCHRAAGQLSTSTGCQVAFRRPVCTLMTLLCGNCLQTKETEWNIQQKMGVVELHPCLMMSLLPVGLTA